MAAHRVVRIGEAQVFQPPQDDRQRGAEQVAVRLRGRLGEEALGHENGVVVQVG